MPYVVAEIPGTRLQQPKEKLRHPTLSKCSKRSVKKSSAYWTLRGYKSYKTQQYTSTDMQITK